MTALANAGQLAEAEGLTQVLSTRSARAYALAAVSVGHSVTGTLVARRLAEAAADEAEAARRSLFAMPFAMMAVRALARAGARDRAVDLAERFHHAYDSNQLQWVVASEQCRVLTALAEELGPYDPAAASALIEALRKRVLADHVTHQTAEHGPVALAELLVALGHRHPELGQEIRSTLEHLPPKMLSTLEHAVTVLLAVERDPSVARNIRTTATVRFHSLPTNHGRERAALAIADAALGDLDAVESDLDAAVSLNSIDFEWRANELCAVAAYLAGAGSDPLGRTISFGIEDLRAVQRLAGLVAPQPPDADGLELAHRLMRRALTSKDWYTALPTLGEIAPDAVTRVRDVIFAHLGLEPE